MPIVDPVDWVTSDDYPSAAIQDKAEGTTAFTLDIGPDGKILRCNVTGSSGSAVLDETTCATVTSRAKFAPAKDRKGRPVADQFSRKITWRLPDTGAVNIGEFPQRHYTELDVNENGEVEACRIGGFVTGRDKVRYSQDPCNWDQNKRRSPVLDAAGKPIKAKVVETLEIVITPR